MPMTIDERISGVLGILKQFSDNKKTFQHNENISYTVKYSEKKFSQLIADIKSDMDKFRFSIMIDPSIRKIDATVSKNSSTVYRGEFRKKLTLIDKNSVNTNIPIFTEFQQYLLQE